MRTKTEERRIRFPAPREDHRENPRGLVLLEEQEDTPCDDYVVMTQERELPALQEYLRERGTRIIH